MDASETCETDKIGAFRRALPQFITGTALVLICFCYGLSLAFPSIVVASLRGVSQTINSNETIYMTAAEASWLASSSFIAQPIASTLSAFLADVYGRKSGLLLINIPHVIAWMILANAKSTIWVFVSFIMLGFSDGLMGPPLMMYIGEVSEPKVRGILLASTSISITAGVLAVFTCGMFLSWRSISLICSVIPVCAFVAICFTPESPIWLISKQRSDDALKSLQWFRGFVSPQAVSTEFNDLKEQTEWLVSCTNCEKLKIKCTHPKPTLWDKLKDMKRKRTLKPFVIITCLNCILQFSGMIAIRPYIVPILNAYGIPFGANFTTVLLGVLGIFAGICIMSTVKMLGKRKIYLFSLVGSFLSCFGLSIYGFIFFPSGWTSFDPNINTNQIQEIAGKWSYFALAMFLVNYFFFSYGISSIPIYLSSEIFPLKSKHFYYIVFAVEFQVLSIISTKTCYELEVWFTLPGAMCFYGFIGFIGFLVAYFIVPETENRTLEDIELHFSNNSLGLTDINIRVGREQPADFPRMPNSSI